MMEGDPIVTAIRVALAIILVTGPGLYPAFQLLNLLQPAHSRTQRFLLLPPLSLLLAFTTAGWLVVILGFHSVAIWVTTMVLMNGIVYLTRRRRQDTILAESPWERLERMIERGEIGDRRALESDLDDDESFILPTSKLDAVGEEESDSSSVEEAIRKRIVKFLDRLPDERIIIAAIALLICLGIPIFAQSEPLGIDWVGFSTLAHRFATVGDASLPPPSVGRWTYPPAFPALAAYLESTLQISPQLAVHILGQLSLFCVIMGAAGAMERFGAGLQTILCIALAAGLFAKTFDSGYPTVASQLGLTVGLMVLVGPETRRDPRRDMALAITVGAVGAIHPTGSAYLAMLLAAHVAAHLIEPGEDARRGGGMVAGTSIILGMAMIVVLGIFAPRLLERAINAEYGWQGGFAMLLWNSPLLLIAIPAAWRLRGTMEGRILVLWAFMLWLLSTVHLFEGLVGPGFLTLFSYVLYSMAMHGFQIPLACIAALALAPSPRLTACSRRLGLDEEAEAISLSKLTGRTSAAEVAETSSDQMDGQGSLDDESAEGVDEIDRDETGDESVKKDSKDNDSEEPTDTTDSVVGEGKDESERVGDEDGENGEKQTENQDKSDSDAKSDSKINSEKEHEVGADEDFEAEMRDDDYDEEAGAIFGDSRVSEQLILWKLPKPAPENLTNILFVIIGVLALLGSAWIATLGEHPELMVRTKGDRNILDQANLPSDSVVLVEGRPWGILIDADPEIGVTDFPRLGLLEIDETFGTNLSHAVRVDDSEAIAWYGITHAITSPRGDTGHVLATSDHWELDLDLDGSRLWRFVESPTTESAFESTFLFADESSCNTGCDWREDAWWAVDEWRANRTRENRPYLKQGSIEQEFNPSLQMRDRWLRITLLVEGSAGHEVTLSAGHGSNMASTTVSSRGEMEQVSLLVHSPVNGSMQITIEVDGREETWLNPMALSGRGDRLADGGGLWIHWVEVRPV